MSKLKQQPGNDILLYGSNQLFNTLLGHPLIDDFRLWVFPLVLGSGMRLFAEGNDPGKLQLADATTFSHRSGRSLLQAGLTGSAAGHGANLGPTDTSCFASDAFLLGRLTCEGPRAPSPAWAAGEGSYAG